MSDGESYTTVSVMTGGDNIADEQVTRVDGTVVKLPVSKILLGDAGFNLGSVSAANPMPVKSSSIEALLVENNTLLRELLIHLRGY